MRLSPDSILNPRGKKRKNGRTVHWSREDFAMALRQSDGNTVRAYAILIKCRNPVACAWNVDIDEGILIYTSVGDDFPTIKTVFRHRAFHDKSLLVLRIVIPCY